MDPLRDMPVRDVDQLLDQVEFESFVDLYPRARSTPRVRDLIDELTVTASSES
jgi:hypothetical protein